MKWSKDDEVELSESCVGRQIEKYTSYQRRVMKMRALPTPEKKAIKEKRKAQRKALKESGRTKLFVIKNRKRILLPNKTKPVNQPKVTKTANSDQLLPVSSRRSPSPLGGHESDEHGSSGGASPANTSIDVNSPVKEQAESVDLFATEMAEMAEFESNLSKRKQNRKPVSKEIYPSSDSDSSTDVDRSRTGDKKRKLSSGSDTE